MKDDEFKALIESLQQTVRRHGDWLKGADAQSYFRLIDQGYYCDMCGDVLWDQKLKPYSHCCKNCEIIKDPNRETLN